MSLFLDIGTGAGLSGATGVRPFLPPLVAGAAGQGDVGVDFEHTSYEFLEEPWFLMVIVALAVAGYVIDRVAASRGGQAASLSERGFPVISVVLGALLFAGSLADGGHETWPGLVAGVLCAAVGYLAVATIFARARRRVEDSAATFLGVYADGVAFLLAAVSILAPPVGLLAIAAFAVLAVRGRGEADRKYGGLRILR